MMVFWFNLWWWVQVWGGFDVKGSGSCGLVLIWIGCAGYIGCGMVCGKACAEKMDGGGWVHGVGWVGCEKGGGVGSKRGRVGGGGR